MAEATGVRVGFSMFPDGSSLPEVSRRARVFRSARCHCVSPSLHTAEWPLSRIDNQSRVASLPPTPNIEFLTGINYYAAAHLFVGTQFTPVETAYGPPGVYFTTSPDFVHWSKPALALTMNQMLRRDPLGNWSYAYFSLIDPRSTDSNL